MVETCCNAILNDIRIMRFESPSNEIEYISEKLPRNSKVLDMGCGDGRHAKFLAKMGFKVDAFDICETGIENLKEDTKDYEINCWVENIEDFIFKKDYDLIIAHDLFQFISKKARERIINEMKIHTKGGGYNIVAVFTDSIEPPEDMKPYLVGVFKEGEVKGYYKDWTIKNYQSLKFEDEHEDNIKHKHAMNKLIVKKPCLVR